MNTIGWGGLDEGEELDPFSGEACYLRHKAHEESLKDPNRIEKLLEEHRILMERVLKEPDTFDEIMYLRYIQSKENK